MKQLILPASLTQKLLGEQTIADISYRMMRWCITVRVTEGILLYNVATRELLLLERNEQMKAEDVKKELIGRWFLVPEYFDEYKWLNDFYALADLVRSKKNGITNYTILTTTNCNARCYYCYEYGIEHVSMSIQTAKDTADYIRRNCRGQEVNIGWFGGEPLCNVQAIDIISDALRKEGISFRSKMSSNCALISPSIIHKAKENWNLKLIQITFDGTEEAYNKVKAYVYPKGNGFQTVMENIKYLLEAGIKVVARLNMDMHSIEDLKKLCDDLADRFGRYSGFSVYPALLFENCGETPVMYSEAQQEKRQLDLRAMWEYIFERKLGERKALDTEIRPRYCIADKDYAIVVTPEGVLRKCEHISEGDPVGSIYEEGKNQSAIDNWKEKYQGMECDACACYPVCRYPKRCPAAMRCTSVHIKSREDELKAAMLQSYEDWKKGRTNETCRI